MGAENSKLKPKTVEHLRAKTNLREPELQLWYKSFLKDYPKGKLKLEEFKKIYKDFFPKGDADYFAEQIFRTFDDNGDGYVDFREFIIGMSVFKKGTVTEKLRWAFTMYDTDKNGEITRDEMLQVVSSIYKMVGNSIEVPENESTPEKRVDKIFNSLDKDENGTLTMEEFIEGAQLDDTIMSLLQC